MPIFNSSPTDDARRHHFLKLIVINSVRTIVFCVIALLGAGSLVWLVPDHMAAPLAPIYALFMVVLAHRWFAPDRRPPSGSAAAPGIEGPADDERSR
ncbi:hypothetical protein [Williamsia sp. D3]|uniref:hypothetical protein n=1 Tax=Williamsia TaxID=85043 RepID=UPI0003D2B6C6|nr:hypothetical protein [Williamsia sp. D3]ETD34315.1 hypothetical protein W823_02835 [Williamsia sp. D3]